jgi:hypothetical protein
MFDLPGEGLLPGVKFFRAQWDNPEARDRAGRRPVEMLLTIGWVFP